MKAIAIFILVLELLALILQIRNECKRYNFTPAEFKKKLISLTTRKKPSIWYRRKK